MLACPNLGDVQSGQERSVVQLKSFEFLLEALQRSKKMAAQQGPRANSLIKGDLGFLLRQAIEPHLHCLDEAFGNHLLQASRGGFRVFATKQHHLGQSFSLFNRQRISGGEGIQQEVQVLVANFGNLGRLGWTEKKIVAALIGSCIERIGRNQIIRHQDQLPSSIDSRPHPEISIGRQDHLVDQWAIIQDGSIVKMFVPTPDRLNSCRGVEFPQQTRQSGYRLGVGRHLTSGQERFEFGGAIDDERQ